ncbi:hypothetical protein [Salinigranum salinum]|uniref:hypothetical protein n=1 Tax=Salinigranum salinum TaxID=1364937 RepID=UPI001260E98A|nr:hypothetical protein [Salinigranum salinum]
MSETAGLRSVVESQRLNALLAWLLVGLLLVAAGVNLVERHPVWAGVTATVAVLALIPAIRYRDPLTMLPWEVLLVASLPIIGRTFVVGQRVGGITLTGRVTTYLAVAAVALVIAVELDAFTTVRMNRAFALLFVVVTTTAAAGVWAVVQWTSDLYLGTSLLLDGRPEEVVETELMWDFVAATATGVLAGLLFEYYFRRRARTGARVAREGRES